MKKYVDIININNDFLTIKELLKEVKYEYNDLYIDKFWENIQYDKWIYIDNNILSWLGYSNIDIISSKRAYIIILKDNFEKDIDYKIINNKEFKEHSKCMDMHLENIEISDHNRTKHLIISPDCFKQSLMMIKTNKAKEIRKYYIELEKIFKFYLQYQAKYQELQNKQTQEKLENKNAELAKNKQNTMIITENMILSYNGKSVVYVAIIGENKIKFGITNKIIDRIKTHKKNFERFEIIYISICLNNLEIENLLKDYTKENNRLRSQVINDHNYTELINIDENFTVEMIINKINENCQIQYDYITLLDKYNSLQGDNEELRIVSKENDRIIILLKDSINDLNLKYNNLNMTNVQLINKYEKLQKEIKEDTKEIPKDVQEKVPVKDFTEKTEEYKKPPSNTDTKVKKKFTCTRCNESFTTSIVLTRHINRKNKCKDINEVIEIKCNLCNKLFKTQSSLNRHINDIKYPCTEVKPKKIYTCEKCNKFFEKKGRYNEHINKQTKCNMILQCKKCNHVFNTIYNYNQHINSKILCI